MQFEFRVLVEVQHNSGTFASDEALRAEIADAIDRANPGYIRGADANENSEYEILTWEV